jgi:hypothetical protein
MITVLAARTMRLGLTANGPPFQNHGLSTAVALGGDWQRYIIYFQATATDLNGRLNFISGIRRETRGWMEWWSSDTS